MRVANVFFRLEVTEADDWSSRSHHGDGKIFPSNGGADPRGISVEFGIQWKFFPSDSLLPSGLIEVCCELIA